MKLRNLLWILIALFVFCNVATSVNAQETVVYIDPSSCLIPQVGETFNVNVSISNVTNLFGYDFILWYNTTMMDCSNVEWSADHFLTPILKPSNIFKIKTIEDSFNETTGAVRVVTTLVSDEPPKNGSGLLVTITFSTTTTDGPSPLKLHWPGFVYPVKLSDPDGNPIPCNATVGEVTVIPEFTLLSLILLLIITTLTITFFKKTNLKQRKRQPQALTKLSMYALRVKLIIISRARAGVVHTYVTKYVSKYVDKKGSVCGGVQIPPQCLDIHLFLHSL